MEYKISVTEARILVLASQNSIRDNFADFIAVKLNMNSSYVAGIIRRLELARCLNVVYSGKRRLIQTITPEALECSKKLLSC